MCTGTQNRSNAECNSSFRQGDRPCTCTALSIQVYGGHSQPHKSGEERLLHVGVFLEGHVLDNRGQLVMVTDHDPALQPAVAVLWVLFK